MQPNRQTTAISFGQLAAALSSLRASNSPVGLARAVSRLVVRAGAVCCRVDVLGPSVAPTPPTLTTIARCLGHDRSDLLDADRDLGAMPAGAGRSAIVGDPERGLTWVIVPLVAQHDAIGALRVALAGADGPPPDLRSFLHHIASSLGLGLSAAEWHAQSEHVSRRLQDSLLPVDLPSADWFHLAARYAPATAGMHVGGDWFDAQLLDAELAISVGDVAGHGVEAAARMGQLRSAITALRLLSRGPDELILHLHRLCDLPEHFATAICARVSPSGQLHWSSAGHFPPVVAHPDGTVDYLRGHPSPPLGTGVEGAVAVHSWQLAHDDMVVLFTDGLVERRDQSLAASVDALLEEIGRGARSRLGPTALVDHVLTVRQDAGSTSDDIAVVAVQMDLERADRPD